MRETAPWHDGHHHGEEKKKVFSFIPVTKHYNLFQCLHRTIFSDSGCRLTQRLESHLPKPSSTLVVQLHPPRCRERETVNTSQASVTSPPTVILPETDSLTTDWRCINLTHRDANETNSAAYLVHWQKEASIYRETRATAVSISISTALSASHLYGFLTEVQQCLPKGCKPVLRSHILSQHPAANAATPETVAAHPLMLDPCPDTAGIKRSEECAKLKVFYPGVLLS